jgi:hypothetical protein
MQTQSGNRMAKRSWIFLPVYALLALLIIVVGACNVQKGIVEALLPKELGQYPHYESKEAVLKEAQVMSDRLTSHIRAWYQGKAPREIPRKLLPNGIDPGIKGFYLQRPEEVNPQNQWIVRPAAKIDRSAMPGLYPDPHATYLVLGAFYAPFGTKVIIDGEFPHSRFFNIQASPPLDPAFYYYNGMFGSPEVPLVDVDIAPLPGNTNPFLKGGDRNAQKRKFRAYFTLAIGNGAKLEPAYSPPFFRAPGNHRFASAFQYQGPLADPASPMSKVGTKRGVWNTGALWIRYYAPDLQQGPLGGVSLPRVLYELPTGERFFLNADFSKMKAAINKTRRDWKTPSFEPSAIEGPKEGWNHDFDILHGGLVGIFRAVGKDKPKDKEYARRFELVATGRGINQPPPGNYEPSASRCVSINYLGRSMAIGSGKVAVLTGRMPTVPKTRQGERIMTGGKARYFSITSYPEPDLFDPSYIGPAYTSIMDDEITTDRSGWYVIAYSRKQDRPKNATTENGVTWVDWGRIARQHFVLRWLSVHPDWRDPKHVPDITNLPYNTTTWLSPDYDKSLVGENNHKGRLSSYLPQMHYMTKEEFESFGAVVRPDTLPLWTSAGGKG